MCMFLQQLCVRLGLQAEHQTNGKVPCICVAQQCSEAIVTLQYNGLDTIVHSNIDIFVVIAWAPDLFATLMPLSAGKP